MAEKIFPLIVSKKPFSAEDEKPSDLNASGESIVPIVVRKQPENSKNVEPQTYQSSTKEDALLKPIQFEKPYSVEEAYIELQKTNWIGLGELAKLSRNEGLADIDYMLDENTTHFLDVICKGWVAKDFETLRNYTIGVREARNLKPKIAEMKKGFGLAETATIEDLATKLVEFKKFLE